MNAEIALLQLVLTPQNGATWFEGSVQGLIQMTSSPRFRASGGNPSLLQQWRALSSGVQCGQGQVPPFHCSPTSPASRLDPQCFRVLLLRRLWCLLPLVRLLPVWPATRAACARTSGVSLGELCRTHLQRGWSEGVHQHQTPGPRPVGDRHDFVCHPRRGCSGPGTPHQGTQIPQVDGRVRSRALGCPCLRDWRPMVRGSPPLLATSHPCQSKVGTTGDPCSGATLLVQTLVHSIVMLCCAGVRLVTVGAPWRFGC